MFHQGCRIALLLEYNGSSFQGNQYQSRNGRVLPTVQQALEDALAGLNLQTSRVVFAGRTDAGVHAKGQVAHFDLFDGDLENIVDLSTSLNALLPLSIRVQAYATDVDPEFHSRYSATHRWYQYKIFHSPFPSVWKGEDAIWVKEPLDLHAMRKATNYLMGTHEFTSFKSTGTPVAHDQCTIYALEIVQEGHYVMIDVVADRFLYKMVRNMAGLLMAIGKRPNVLPPDTVTQILQAQDRRALAQISQSAKANGLSLLAVRYLTGLSYFNDNSWVQRLNTFFPVSDQVLENSQAPYPLEMNL